MKRCYLVLFVLLLTIGSFAQSKPLIMYGITDYQLTCLSPNGKWACGAFSNGASAMFAFRWNLMTNEINLLSEGNDETTAFKVSDNGVVVGTFPSKEVSVNKAPIATAGYWKDGKWHLLETLGDGIIDHPDYGGMAYCISRNGEYIGGALYSKDHKFTPVVWKDGKVYKNFDNGYEGSVLTVSNDGKVAGGWCYTKISAGTRVPVLWQDGKEPLYLCPEEDGNFWRSAKALSPDEKLVLYDQNIYNLETGEKSEVPSLADDTWNFDMYSMTNDRTIVGYESTGEFGSNQYAIIYKDGVTGKLEDYLKEKGVDFSKDGIVLPNPELEGSYFISTCVGISEDGKTFAMMFYDANYDARPMIVKLDENVTTREPVTLKCEQLDGIYATKLTWKAPLANEEGVKGYNVYRNGTKVNTTLLTDTRFVDSNLSKETYNYAVTAVYADTESVKSEETTITLVDKKIESPYNLFARQRGLNDAYLLWSAPMSNLITKKYYELGKDMTGFGGGNVSFESAIRYGQEEMSLYKGYKITSVSFYPMTRQDKWTINIYNNDELIHSEEVTSELKYGQENNIKLNKAVAIPANGDVYIAIKVAVPSKSDSYNVIGLVYGNPVPGYSDLVRQDGEKDFYSLYEESLKNGYDFSISWGISMILSPENVDENIDKVNQYNVYVNGTKVGSAQECTYTLAAQPDGTYTYEVEAAYANGKVSDKVATELSIEKNEKVYKSILSVNVTKSDDSDSKIIAKWEAPIDNDETFITYSGDAMKGGLVGPKKNNYNYMVKAVYDKSKLEGYAGYEVKALRFYPLTDADFTFMIDENGKEVCNQYVENYTLNQWNTVVLEKPFTIQDGVDYDLILDCFDVTPEEAPIGHDGLVPFIGLSDLYSTNEGESFNSIFASSSVSGNWMIGMVISASEGGKLPIEGYNVRIDGEKKNDALLTDTQFTYDFGVKDNDTHRINVDVTYTVVGEKKGNAVFFTLDMLDGIENAQVALIRVFPNPATSYVKVEGGNVESIKAYNTAGQQVAYSETETLNVSSLEAGMYILSIRMDGVEKTAKINVIK